MSDDPRTPKYRFRGQTPPAAGARASILLEQDPDVAGVVTMRLYDPIDSWGGDWGVSAKEFAVALTALPSDTSEIRLHINSPGGEVFEAFAILNQLRAHKARVVAVVDGLAASAASFIATGADEVVMGANTQLMIHDAWGLAVGNSGDMRTMGDLLDKLSNNIASVYSAKAGGSPEEWRAVMLAETWYDAQEAVDAGLADSVSGAADVKASFDLTMFEHAGRENAPAPVPTAVAPEPSGGDPDILRRRSARKAPQPA